MTYAERETRSERAASSRRRRWSARLVRVAAVAAAAALAVAACGGSDKPKLLGVVQQPAVVVGDVTLPATDGRQVPFRAAEGELLVMYFGYTSCPDICPTTLNDTRIALDELPPEMAARVTVAFATVDPERDTAEVVDGYVGSFVERSIGLRTEDPDELATAAEALGVQYEIAAHEPGDRSYEVGHSAVTYVIDDTGTLVVEWPFGFPAESMTADLRSILS